jgi:predicted CXXCH cytochrome family protein
LKKLGCISCHDPHQKPEPAQAAGYFRQRCLACHQEKGCSLHLAERWRRSPGDNCAACHMPRAPADNIAHVALTDHTIVRPGRPAPAGRPLPPGEPPVVLFHRDRVDEGDPERRRDLGVALVRLLRQNRVPAAYRDAAVRQSSLLLEEALGRAPTDPEGWQTWGEVLALEQQVEPAIAAFERALGQAPNNEKALERLANLEAHRGRAEQAARYWKRAVEVNPTNPGSRRALGLLLAEAGDWAAAEAQARAWVGLEPGSSAARQLLTLSLLGQGRRQEARREFEGLRRLKPGNLAELETWFRRRGG